MGRGRPRKNALKELDTVSQEVPPDRAEQFPDPYEPPVPNCEDWPGESEPNAAYEPPEAIELPPEPAPEPVQWYEVTRGGVIPTKNGFFTDLAAGTLMPCANARKSRLESYGIELRPIAQPYVVRDAMGFQRQVKR